MATTLPATTTTQADLDRLAEHYAFRRPDDVAAFLETRPEVVGPLLEAIEVVPRYFGLGTRVALEVERDRDAEGHVRLFALVRTDTSVDDGLARFDRFCWEWWLEVLPRAAPYLIFGIE